jgi:Skp family chaperone for outer membrane proteins
MSVKLKGTTVHKKYLSIFIAITFNYIILSSAYASERRASVVAIVDVQMILERSKAAQSVRTNIETISKNIQKQMDDKTSELNKLEAELSKKREKISEENFEKDLLDFNKKVSALERHAKESKNKLEKAYSAAIHKVQEEINKTIHDLAKEKGFEVVLPASIVIYHAPVLNITEIVIERLNHQLKEVKIDY